MALITRNLDLLHILNLKNAGDGLPKTCMFSLQVVERASLRRNQTDRVSLQRESMGRASLHRNQADRTSFRRKSMVLAGN